MGFEEKFAIIKELGKGATAKVYLVERRIDKRLFAAKIISIKEASNKDYVMMNILRKPSQMRLRLSRRSKIRIFWQSKVCTSRRRNLSV